MDWASELKKAITQLKTPDLTPEEFEKQLDEIALRLSENFILSDLTAQEIYDGIREIQESTHKGGGADAP